MTSAVSVLQPIAIAGSGRSPSAGAGVSAWSSVRASGGQTLVGVTLGAASAGAAERSVAARQMHSVEIGRVARPA